MEIFQSSKFLADWSNYCFDMAFFDFSRWRPSAIVIFKSSKSLPVRFIVSICVIMPNFMQIKQSMAEIWSFLRFFKMSAVRHIDLL